MIYATKRPEVWLQAIPGPDLISIETFIAGWSDHDATVWQLTGKQRDACSQRWPDGCRARATPGR